jgi:glycosyltransferase involved in cell wall biosynthesis
MAVISIIIPTYNSANTIRLALDTLLCQSFTDYEILVIDGISTDKTLEIVNEYKHKCSCVTLISEEDRGVYDAMNKGIDLAQGEWVYFLGSDDSLHDDKVFEDVVAITKKEPVDIIYGDAIVLSNNQRFGGEFDILRIQTENNLCHQTIFYRKSIFERIGKYNLKYKVAADWDMNIRCFRHPEIRTLYIDRIIVFFNNLTGISSLPHDDPFYDQVPVPFIRQMVNSRAYKIGGFIDKLLKKLKVGRN